MIFPRIVYGGTTLDASQPARPLRQELPRMVGGGVEWSAAGVPAAWEGRWERPLTVTQRIMESEWPAFRAWLEHAMLGGTFTWRKTPTAPAHICYLDFPSLEADGELAPLDFPGDLELTYTVRRTDGAAIDEVTFP